MISGKSVYQDIKGKVDELEEENNGISSDIEEYRKRIEGLARERDSYFEKLAELYLPTIESSDVQKTIREVRGEIQAIFKKRQERRAFLQEQMADLARKRHSLEQRIEGVTEDLTESSAKIDETKEKIADDLSKNEKYTALHKSASQAQESLEQNKNRFEAFKAHASKQIKAYESDPLFMYLVNQGFGAPNQRGSALIRTLDSAVARVARFSANKPNYDFLKSMPGLIEEEIAGQQNALDAVVGELKKIEDEAAEKYGLPAMTAQAKILYQNRVDMLNAIERVDKENKEYTDGIEELSRARNNGYYNEAKGRLENFLKSETIEGLRARAIETPRPEDDELVRKIESVNGKYKRANNEMDALREKRAETASNLEKARELEREFRRKNYDSPRSRFDDDFDTGALLTGYILGRMSSHDVFKTMDDSHHLKPQETYYSSSSYPSSHHDDDSSSGSGIGFSSGGWSSGGGIGGGGGWSSGSGIG